MTASGRQLKKPISLKRPEWVKKRSRPIAAAPTAPGNVVPISQAPSSPGMASAVSMLRGTTRSVVRTG